MAIKLNVKKTIDFTINDEDKGFTYHVKFHQTPELGETISLSVDGEEYIGYPAEALADIVDTLRAEGMLKKPESEEAEPESGSMTPFGFNLSLPIPQVEGKPKYPKGAIASTTDRTKLAIGKMPTENQYGFPTVFEVAEGTPIETFQEPYATVPEVPKHAKVPSVPLVAKKAAIINDSTAEEVSATDDDVVDVLLSAEELQLMNQARVPVAETPDELKEDAERMMLERAEALANVKAKGPKKVFKRAHIEGEEE
jgi:hypothetical protein